MSFGESVSSVLTQYAEFSGRARRSEYWWFYLFGVVVSGTVSRIDTATHSMVLGLVVTLALLLPSLAVSVRRLHDIGRSGWWLLIALTGVGIIVLIVFHCMDSEPGPNRFGPSEKDDVAQHEWSQHSPTAPPNWR